MTSTLSPALSPLNPVFALWLWLCQTIYANVQKAYGPPSNWISAGVRSMHRVGIVPFDIKGKLTALLFVTSSSRGRWILPKGLAKANESHADTCHREGFEEAGVRGEVFTNFPCTVVISKTTSEGMEQIPVTYYPYLVKKQEDTWPESKRRLRHWTLVQDAAKVAYKDDFLGLINQFRALEPWIREAATEHKS
ncbi:MAG: NUDIX domain-containing protein [Pseudomonadota bacterium]